MSNRPSLQAALCFAYFLASVGSSNTSYLAAKGLQCHQLPIFLQYFYRYVKVRSLLTGRAPVVIGT